MATQTGGLIQDQNLNVHYDGASVGGKNNASKAQKKGGVGGRKPFIDLTNSGKPTPLQASKKHNSKNLISIGEDTGASKSTSSIGGKLKVSKGQEKVQTGGRKALTNITNSGKPWHHQASQKNLNKKLGVVAKEQLVPKSIVEEQFLHNHQECINAQSKAMDMDYFLKTIGLDHDFSMQLASPRVLPVSRKSKPESPLRYLELEEMAELPIEDRSPRGRKTELMGERKSPPPCGTPKSPKPYMNWKDYNFCSFILMETPESPKINPFI